jgi:dGTPase
MAAPQREARRQTDSLVRSPRTEFERDRDRILYASALRRLAGVSQVVAAAEGHVFHNRLTHVLKVAQIGRGLAEQVLHDTPDKSLADALGGLSPDVVESAALAHDLGHPPFGHIAEHELDCLVRDQKVSDGFEGNAQSFRIVTKLAVRANDSDGLNLTRATLNGLLKYPWFRGTGGTKKERKWGAYHTEEEDFQWARESFPPGDERKSVEAELMDWADDIAYSVYDMEDGYRAGKVPLDRLVSNGHKLSPEAERFLHRAFERWKTQKRKFDPKEMKDAFLFLMSAIPFRDPYCGRREQRAALRSMTSSLVARYIRAVSLNPKAAKTGARRITLQQNAETEVEILKELTWQYVIDDPSLATQQYGYRKVIRDMFEIFLQATKTQRDWVMFPIGVREQLDRAKEQPPRIVADFIASMTEQQALEMYQRIAGISFGSVLKSIV